MWLWCRTGSLHMSINHVTPVILHHLPLLWSPSNDRSSGKILRLCKRWGALWLVFIHAEPLCAGFSRNRLISFQGWCPCFDSPELSFVYEGGACCYGDSWMGMKLRSKHKSIKMGYLLTVLYCVSTLLWFFFCLFVCFSAAICSKFSFSLSALFILYPSHFYLSLSLPIPVYLSQRRGRWWQRPSVVLLYLQVQ